MGLSLVLQINQCLQCVAFKRPGLSKLNWLNKHYPDSFGDFIFVQGERLSETILTL